MIGSENLGLCLFTAFAVLESPHGLFILLLPLFLGIGIFNASLAYPIAFIMFMFLSVYLAHIAHRQANRIF
jgi:hypothetical protein